MIGCPAPRLTTLRERTLSVQDYDSPLSIPLALCSVSICPDTSLLAVLGLFTGDPVRYPDNDWFMGNDRLRATVRFPYLNVRLSECGLPFATVIFSEHVCDIFPAAAL